MAQNTIALFEREIQGKDKQVYDVSANIGPLGDFSKLSGIDAVITAIKNLLHTPLGFYPFDPKYGSLLYKKVFQPADQISVEEIEYEVTYRIAKYEDRVTINKIDSYWAEDGKCFIIDIHISRDGTTGVIRIDPSDRAGVFGLSNEGAG